MVYQVQFQTNLLKLFAHPENSECFFTISGIIFEVNVVPEQRQA